MKVWDAATGQETLMLWGHSLSFSADGKRIALADPDTVKVWDVARKLLKESKAETVASIEELGVEQAMIIGHCVIFSSA